MIQEQGGQSAGEPLPSHKAKQLSPWLTYTGRYRLHNSNNRHFYSFYRPV